MFKSELDVRVKEPGTYVLLTELTYHTYDFRIITVPAGFKTDFASVPRGFRWLVDGHGDTRRAAVVHDYLYSWARGDRKEADDIFMEAMVSEGVGLFKRYICYAAVRAGGWITWEKNRAKRR